MEIPSYTASGTTDLQSDDKNKALKNTLAATSLLNTATGIAQDSKDAQDRLQADQKKAQDKFQTDQMTAEVTASNNVFERDNASKLYYSADELPDNESFQKTRMVPGPNGEMIEQPRTDIPAYEVQPELYKQRMDAQLKAGSANVPASKRANWELRMREMVDTKYTNMVIKANAKQQQEMQGIATQDWKESLKAQDYTTATFLSSSFPGTKEERTSMMNITKKYKEMGGYSDSMSENNLAGIDANIAHLRDKGYEGQLNPQQRMSTVASLESKKKQISSSDVSTDRMAVTRLKDSVTNTISALNEGKIISPQKIMMLQTDVTDMISTGTKGLERSAVDLENLVRDLPDINAFMTASPMAQRKYIDKLPTSTGNEQAAKSQWEKRAEYAHTQLTTDSMKYAQDTGMYEVPEIDWNNQASITEGLRKRVDIHEDILDKTGSSTGPLDELALNQLVGAFDQATSDERIQLSTTLHDSLGASSEYVWNQLVDKGMGVNAVAGSITSNGDVAAGRMVFQGLEVLKEFNQITPSKSEDYRAKLNNSWGNAFPIPGHRKAMGNAVNAVYAQLASRDGDYTGEYSKDRLVEAEKVVTGGMVNMWDKTLQPPVRGMKDTQFKAAVLDMADSEWEKLGGIREMSVPELRDQLTSGRVQMIQRRDKEYLLYSTMENGYLSDKTGTSFVYKYNPNAEKNVDKSVGAFLRDMWGQP